MSKVSIIVPIYNVEKYVEKCVKSLLNQTFRDITIYAISDGSQDNSIEIVKKISKDDKRVICIEKENGGYGSVLSYAIGMIKSKYFLICDPDDYISNDCIEKLYNAAEENDADLIVADKYLVYDDIDGKTVKEYKSSNNKNIIVTNKKYEKDELNLFNYLESSPHAKLYKTSYAMDIDFPFKVSYTDTLLYYVYITKCKSAVYIDDALAFYLIDRPGNTMTDINPKVIDYKLTVLKYIENQIDTSKNVNHTKYCIISSYMIVLNTVKKYALKDEKKKYYNIIYNEISKYKKDLKEIKHSLCMTNIKAKYLRYFLLKSILSNKVLFNIFKYLYCYILEHKNKRKKRF